MSSSWQADGADLDTATVKVTVEDVQEANDIRRQREALLHGSETEHRLGKNRPRVRLRFNFTGQAPDRYTEMANLRNLFLDNDSVGLQAPDTPNEFYLIEDEKDADLKADRVTVVHHGGTSRVSLDVEGELNPRLDLLTEAGDELLTEAGEIIRVET